MSLQNASGYTCIPLVKKAYKFPSSWWKNFLVKFDYLKQNHYFLYWLFLFCCCLLIVNRLFSCLVAFANFQKDTRDTFENGIGCRIAVCKYCKVHCLRLSNTLSQFAKGVDCLLKCFSRVVDIFFKCYRRVVDILLKAFAYGLQKWFDYPLAFTDPLEEQLKK